MQSQGYLCLLLCFGSSSPAFVLSLPTEAPLELSCPNKKISDLNCSSFAEVAADGLAGLGERGCLRGTLCSESELVVSHLTQWHKRAMEGSKESLVGRPVPVPDFFPLSKAQDRALPLV